MNKVTSQAAQPLAANSTGGQVSARAPSPAGHFSHSEIPAQGGGCRELDYPATIEGGLHCVLDGAADAVNPFFRSFQHSQSVRRAGATSAESAESGLFQSQLVEGQHLIPDAVATHGTAGAGGGAQPHGPAAAQIEDDGFITVHHFPPCGFPRNHAEEIANALAYADHLAREEEDARFNFEMECG